MSQFVSDPPKEKTLPATEENAAPARPPRARSPRIGFVTLFVLVGLSLLLFSGQIILGLTQTDSASAAQQARNTVTPTPVQGTAPALTPTPTVTVPFSTPNNTLMPTLQLPAGHYVIYQNDTHIYLASTTDNTVLSVYTPGYTYSQAVRPLLTPDGQLLYSGSQGIWLTDLFDQQPTQIAQLDPNTEIASLALSQDGKMIAWSTEPVDGSGQASIYAGPLADPQLIRQQSTLDCPCLRIFSFLNGSASTADHTLLLTDDRGSDEAVQYGLWSLDISKPSAQPQLIMGENSQQGPLAFVPYSNTLLYAPYEGAVPVPTDGSVPADVAALSYANGMSIASLDSSSLALGTPQVVLPGPKNMANGAQSYWITTPTFSPDGQTLAYIEFSSDSQDPYDRHSALYTVSISGSGAHLQVGHPQLITISTAKLLELGPWLNSHVITIYGDNAIYALDLKSGSLTTLTRGGSYLRIIATVGTGQT